MNKKEIVERLTVFLSDRVDSALDRCGTSIHGKNQIRKMSYLTEEKIRELLELELHDVIFLTK
jgi:hypothetical protein